MRLLAFGLLGMIAACPARGDEPPPVTALQLQPPALTLEGPRDARRFLVLGTTNEGQQLDVTDRARVEPLGDGLIVGPDGFIGGIKDGSQRVRVQVGAVAIEADVTARDVAAPRPISFVRDVQPILSKVGCNAGTCHGSAKGKNGFKLSLRGYDLAFDHAQLVDDLAGRRFNRAAPDQSLMLLKPTMGVPHLGGQVLAAESEYYRIIRDWVAEGVRSDVGATARVASIAVVPETIDFNDAGESRQLQVIATYPDGSTREVTREAGFESNAPTVATVSKDGRIASERRGEAAVLVRYEGVFAVSGVTVMGQRNGYQWTNPPTYNFIDELVDQKLQRMKILPSAPCDDADFLRRASFDLVGLPPTPEKIRAFLADSTESRIKRERVIEELIDSPEFVAHWTHRLADLLQVNRKLIGEKGTWAFLRWIEESVARGMPYDELVRAVVTAQGSSFDHPAVNYFRANKEPSVALENATQLFLGVRFSCNKCHDHPFERWTQDQYYEMAAFWGQVGVKGGQRPEEQIVFDRPSGDVMHPRTGKVAAPGFPYKFEAAPATAEGASRRAQLASWLTAPENPYFARSFVNRIWSYFLGRGIIDPVDDIRQSNPPSNPALLAALEKDFLDHKFDIRHLMRTIARSRTYQASIATNEFNADDAMNFSHATPRRLSAEQLMDALHVAAGHTPRFDGVPGGFRAQQLPDSQAAGGGFLDLFGRPARETPCECERSGEVSLAQALSLVNGPTIADVLIDPNGRIAKLIAGGTDDARIVEDLYLAAWGRLPTAAEATNGAAYLSQSASKPEGAQDLMWALVNSPGFLFNR